MNITAEYKTHGISTQEHGDHSELPRARSNELFVTDSPQVVGLGYTYPLVGSSVYQTLGLKNIHIRGPFHTGLRLRQAWNARVEDVFINGLLSEVEYANPQAMQYGMDIGDSMDTHIIRPSITSANIGIQAGLGSTAPVRAEGLQVHTGFLQHVNVGIFLYGGVLGGWPTPAQWIMGGHINHLRHAVMAYQVSGLHIKHVDLYASHLAVGQWALYLIACKNVQISGNYWWANRGGPFGAILLDACENVEIDGGIIDDSVSTALFATASCRNVYTSGGQWERAAKKGKVQNNAQNE